jgi:hypothetical protein
MLVRFRLPEQTSSNQFTKELVENYVNNALKAQLGKIGLAKFTYEISKIMRFDFEVWISLKDVIGDDLLVFWSSLAFNSNVKVELKDMNYK